MPSLSKKYKINNNKRYTIQKNKKLRGNKSIKLYDNRVKRLTRKRKHYIGGDIEVPPINNIFPNGQTYQPNMDCLEKECDKGDAGEMTTTCLNTQIVMNLFSQTLDDSEEKTLDRIGNKLTDEERKQVKDLTEKYLTNYVDSLFSRSIFSKNNVDLTPENAPKLKELLKVINPEYIDYLTRDSNLSDDIKQLILATQEELNIATTPSLTQANSITQTSTPAQDSSSSNAPTSTPAVNDAAIIEAERVKKVAEDAEAERLRVEVTKKAAEDAEAERLRVEVAKKAAEDAEAERVKKAAELEQAKQATLNEVKQINQTRIDATNKANDAYADAVKQANQIRVEAVEKANQELETNVKNGMSKTRYNFKHTNALNSAKNTENKAIKSAEKVKNKAINNATIAEKNAIDAIKMKISAKKNLVASNKASNP